MTDSIDALIKKRTAFKNFAADAEKTLNHAYMFTCEDGEARIRLLYACAKKAFCKTMCDTCLYCRGIEDGTFPDAVFYDGANLKVPDVTAITESALIRPVVADKKLFLIDNADKLSPQAQNKLLKTYEEPPAFLTIILACSSENGILATIKSRAKKLYFDSFTAKEITDYLIENGTDRRQAEVAAAIGNGNLEKAEKFLGSEVFIKLYDACFDLLLNLDTSSKIPQYVFGEAFSKENLPITFDILEIILSDVMKISSKSLLPLLNFGREYDVKSIAKKYGAQSAAAALSVINEGRIKLNSFVSAASCAENVLFGILEARYKWQ